ncbi:MAG: alpha/beta fold hydrolase [Duganella sp.]
MKPAANRMVVTLPWWVLAPLRVAFQLVGRLYPPAAVYAFKWLLSHMPRKKLSARDRDFLRGGHRLDFDCGDAVLAGYSFGAGPTVLLVHGLQGSAANFHALAPALARRGYRAVVFDAIGHGNSPDGAAFSPRTIGHLRQVMAQLAQPAPPVQPLQPTPSTPSAPPAQPAPLHAVISHSAGAYLTMLALCDPPPGVGVERCVYLAPYPDIATTLRTFTDYLRVPRAVTPALQRWFEAIGGVPFAQQSMAYCLPRHRTPAAPPCLFIHDAHDRHIALDRTRDTLEALAGVVDARLRVTTDLGHFRILGDPGVIAEIVDFIQPTSER